MVVKSLPVWSRGAVPLTDHVHSRSPEPALKTPSQTGVDQVLPCGDVLGLIFGFHKPFRDVDGFIIVHRVLSRI